MKCVFCGEKPAEIEISNPNGMEEQPETWSVCKSCEGYIARAQRFAIEKLIETYKVKP